MSILFVLIPLSLALMGIAVWALFWAIDSGQFDELDKHSRSILEDETDADRS
jgi:cbb3-type cytochrome oxidase maturation protein